MHSFRKSLAGIGLLSEVSPAQLADLERGSQWRRYHAKEQIFDSESEGTELYFVVEGSIQILNYSPTGREISFAQVEKGGYFGELAALDGGARSASAVAPEESVLASIAAPAFRALLLEHPRIAYAVLLKLSGVVRSADARIMDLSTLSAINRIHIELLRLVEPIEDGGNVGIIRPVPTQSGIAGRTSTTRETVSRVLSHLTRVRVIERMSGALKVLDIQRLGGLIEATGE